jgi:hypothetical protein
MKIYQHFLMIPCYFKIYKLLTNNGTINNYDGVIYTYNTINGIINGNIPVNI